MFAMLQRLKRVIGGPEMDRKARFDAVEKTTNRLWEDSERGARITTLPPARIRSDSRIFAMGSCFAVEIRNALRDEGFDVYPRYFDLPINPQKHSVGLLPRRDNINHYDTFLIRQEIERAVAGNRYPKESFWQLFNHKRNRRLKTDSVWQDPYRRDVFAASREECKVISDAISETIDQGVREADVVIITLGLTETWKNRSNGLHVCQGPKTDEDEVNQLAEFHPSSFSENLSNLNAIIEAIDSLPGQRQIVLTVSPVALAKTFRDLDVVVANTESKAILRAAAGEACTRHDAVSYWPSFEFAQAGDVFEVDGRHVRREAVDSIVSGFLAASRKQD